MRQDRHIPLDQKIEKGRLQALRCDVVGRLDEDVARICERQHLARAEPGHAVGRDVDIGAGHERQRDALAVERLLQLRYRRPDRRPGIAVEAGHDVRRAGDNGHSVADELPGHVQGYSQISRSVVETGQDVAVQVDHDSRDAVASNSMPAAAELSLAGRRL